MIGDKNKSQFQLKKLQNCWSLIEERKKLLSLAERNSFKKGNVFKAPRNLWAASAVTSAAMTSEYGYESDYISGSDKYIETSKRIPGEDSGKKRRRKKPGQRSVARKVQQQPCQDNRSCLEKMLASNCWLSYLCWALCCTRPKCPAYTSCPCGPRGPCAKMKPKPCPAIKAKSNNGACNNGPPSCKSPCSALCGKIFGKNHIHTECCCRCKDNPPLHGRRKKRSVPREPSPPPQSPPQTPMPTEYGSDAALDKPSPGVQPVLVYSKHSDFDLGRKYKVKRLGRSTKLGVQPKLRLKEVRKKQLSANTLTGYTPTRLDKSGEESPTNHKIVKTFATSQGPVRVEQKIELKGTNDSFVIVSHSKACECNLCRAVKNQKKSNKYRTTDDGREPRLNPEQMNHNENCSCSLCTVLWNDFTEQKRKEVDFPSTLTSSSTGDNYENQGSLDSSTIDDSFDRMYGDKAPPPRLGELARPKFLMNARRKVGIRSRACYCSQCTQRRDVRKLKRRLGEDLGFAEFYKLLQNFSQQYGNDPSSSSNNWSSDKTQETIFEVPMAEIKEEEPAKQSPGSSSWRPSNWAFGTDPIFMNHDDESEDKPKIMHWLQSSPDFVKSLESKLSVFVPDPEESVKDTQLSAVDS